MAQNKPAVSLTVEGGVGLEYKAGIKGAKDLEGKVGGAVKGEIEVSSEGVKVSAKSELGGHIGPVKLGGVEAEQVTRNEHGESEKPTVTLSKPGVELGKSEITGWKNEITIGASFRESHEITERPQLQNCGPALPDGAEGRTAPNPLEQLKVHPMRCVVVVFLLVSFPGLAQDSAQYRACNEKAKVGAGPPARKWMPHPSFFDGWVAVLRHQGVWSTLAVLRLKLPQPSRFFEGWDSR